MWSNFNEMYFFNDVIDKAELKKIIIWAFRKYGITRASNMADKLKDIGFFYATKAGISLSLEDLRIPPVKSNLLNLTNSIITETDKRYKRGEITAVERFQKIIDTWNDASDNLKSEVISYFKQTDPLNPIYMMAFSGARANISQVRQLVGMRGLMSDPLGQIIDLPISSNFREGLTITDYFISSYGARKGLVDTALRTADSGYLTRRLVDVAQDVIVREYDCKTSSGILLEEMIDQQKVLIGLKQALLGRVLAEDLIDNKSKKIIAKSNQSIGPELVDKIIKLNLSNILVRSPLTCSSLKSVCQLCYGWNLAHGKMVDLGEAVGIIAAQSIGEPGTQLTMRTFHTGGVFTGQLSQNILSEDQGYLYYPNNINAIKVRTKHGDSATLINSDCQIKILNAKKQVVYQNLLKGSFLLINNGDYVNKGQLIAQYSKNNRLIKEKAQKTVLADFSGSIHFIDNPKKLSDIRSIKEDMVIWVLGGKVYDIPSETQLIIKNNQKIQENTLLACNKLFSHYSGHIFLIKKNNSSNIAKLLLVISSKLYTNIKISINIYQDYKRYILELENKDRFLLKCKPNTKIYDQQIIADMISDAYKTKTGGIIKYLDLSIIKSTDKDNSKEIYNINGSGYILWISEETHIINKDISLLLVSNGQFVEVGTEIIQNIFACNSGIVEILEKDGIIREVVIKPGVLHKVEIINKEKVFSKLRGFLRPGEKVFGISTDKLVYWEYININQKPFILLRPVIIYAVPQKNILFKYSKNSFRTDNLDLKLTRCTYFKDGERIKSVSGVNLVTTHLICEFDDRNLGLKSYIQLEGGSTKQGHDIKAVLFMKFITVDFLSLKDSYFNNEDLYTKTTISIKNGQYVHSNTIVAKTDIFTKVSGQVSYIKNLNNSSQRILIISESNIYKYSINSNQIIKKELNDWVCTGDHITSNIISECSGKIISIDNNQVTIRVGQPYLISAGSFLHVLSDTLIKRGENIATLIFERSKTGDIIQGLPRIEEILEARKKSDAIFNPHLLLEAKFNLYLHQGLTVSDATRLSFLEIQILLVKEVQFVYQSQGVDIADKHIEVIVKQMTSKVKIENGGDTEFLPGEIIDLQKIESINKSLKLMSKKQAFYQPILLGITKASLNTDSFISAASFQETTKVLTEAAISGKLDWLRGLKENVIIGRLIPAGTGFNAYNTHQQIMLSVNSNLVTNISKDISYTNKDDIIIDDRQQSYINFFNK
uniref:DNA-directed RNA polymerase subunit beta'' n=1 Tax=Taenioma perpusillum TaxID=210852 RepID=A0A1Z1MQZ3_9FLOR|nr:RNA polymerase b''''-subunit [Taenioma perpusillum]ARW68500.1 RNA polymerase b''''-subunit [Taenioma perpusillum]